MFSEKDLKQIHDKGITVDQVNAQVTRLKNGMSYSDLLSAATIGKGVESYNTNEIDEFIRLYEAKQNDLSIVKFVPASGAATRMFKFLFKFLKGFNPKEETISSYAERHNDDLILQFVNNFENFPFYQEVVAKAKALDINFEVLSDNDKLVRMVSIMLDDEILKYSFLPKGLLPFHKYKNGTVTAFQEHLFESTLYASSNDKANLHFTISKKHHAYFIDLLNKIRKTLETNTNTHFNVSFSYQKEATETVALAKNGKVYRNEDDSILFRPAGHGALLENLNDLNHDFIFIKNIDNIVVADRNIEVSSFKKLLAGVLFETQEKVFAFLHKLDEAGITESDLKVMVLFLRYRLNVPIEIHFDALSKQKKIDYLKDKFNRPLRVCGMVKNQGEPGGGPFWVKNKSGNVSLQIVEFAQIDFRRKSQQEIVYKATHFNPTDLVCGVKNYKGEKFDLRNFVDPEAAFITLKTHNGSEIKALELPGLWNGSMAYWNSIFVEVPLETFNPVKTVNDLLKPEHQPLI
ncbi:DUF4301 family protein [Tamlana fucoidanivorans]|uniref:DUF4301 family protein n=1 Tax=Allotamlana fucoidanivorans TaxID=2583814 RepID=A0A5C4SJV3_9FLAO|nr:DUF4301 family protein [Tamlana fucoidanivorans]TNJ44196.1 DUF4301 family protein [Tamlana fucoidanivorans]